MNRRVDDESFQREYASYLCNVQPGLRVTGKRPGTCRVCATPVSDGFTLCFKCQQVYEATVGRGEAFPIDFIAFLTYAVEGLDLTVRTETHPVDENHDREGRQAYAVLKGYKAAARPRQFWITAVTWMVWFLQRWGPWSDWKERRYDREWLWVTVPSVRSARNDEHPLHKIVATVLDPGSEVTLRTSLDMNNYRDFNSEIFQLDAHLGGSKILLIDDSWASGGNLLSAAAALRKAGASRVNAMVLGRLLNPGKWSPSRDFIDNDGLHLDFHDGLRPGFDVARNPWHQVTFDGV
jgi:hypothetical protein